MAQLAKQFLLVFSMLTSIIRADDRATWLSYLDQSPGDFENGADLFTAKCSGCHHSTSGTGSPGPTLSTLKSGDIREKLLTALLSGIRPIATGHDAVLFILETGDTATGIVDNESATEITLRTPQGLKVLDVAGITGRKKLPPTLKPSGFFNSLPREEIRDLITWLTASPGDQESPSNKATPEIQLPHLEAEDLKAEFTGGKILRRNMNPFPNSHWGGNHTKTK